VTRGPILCAAEPRNYANDVNGRTGGERLFYSPPSTSQAARWCSFLARESRFLMPPSNPAQKLTGHIITPAARDFRNPGDLGCRQLRRS
jgi:hypothetical protein